MGGIRGLERIPMAVERFLPGRFFFFVLTAPGNEWRVLEGEEPVGLGNGYLLELLTQGRLVFTLWWCSASVGA